MTRRHYLALRVFPTAICVAIVIRGLIGFRALLFPTGIPLGIAVAWMGVWMIRTASAPAAASEPDEAPARAGPSRSRGDWGRLAGLTLAVARASDENGGANRKVTAAILEWNKVLVEEFYRDPLPPSAAHPPRG